MSVNSKMTALADEIRELSGTEEAMGLDTMTNYVDEANTDVATEANLIEQIASALEGKAAGGEQATPEISVNSNGLVTATAGTKTSTYQLAFQPAKTITPGTTNQIAVSSGYYTGGNVTVTGDSNLIAGNIKNGVKIFDVTGTYENNSGELVDYSNNEDKIINGNIVNYTNDRITTIASGAFAFCKELVSINIPQCKIINGKEFTGHNLAVGAFTGCSKLTTANFPVCTSIGPGAFWSCSSLTSISFPVCTSIGYGAFAECSRLTSISFPSVSNIPSNAFYRCFRLTSISFPVCTTIKYSAFQYCSSLTSVSFPVCTTIGGNAFECCSSLTSISFPVCTTIGGWAFKSCTSLTSISFPVCTYIDNYAFSYCYNLTSVNFPACTSIGGNAFYNCSNLTIVSFPVCTTISHDAFASCSSLTSISLPACAYISSWAFQNCYNLKSLYLTGSNICKLSNSNAFKSTPIGGYSTSAGTYGSIYVPASLLTSYQTATNWTYFSNRFVGI